MREGTPANSIKNRINTLATRFIYSCLVTWVAISLFCLIGLIARSFTLAQYLDQASQPVLIHYYVLSLRSDLLASSYLFAPLFILGLLTYSSKNTFLPRILYPSLGGFILAITSFLCISSYYYWGIFGNHFDEHLFDSETQLLPLLLSLWKDYPVVLVLIVCLFTGYLGFKILQWSVIKLAPFSNSKIWWLNLIIVCEFLLLYINSFHGWSVEPLFWQYRFSKNPVINKSSMNPEIALFNAFSDNSENNIDQQFSKISLQQGFDYYRAYFEKNLTSKQFSTKNLFTHTPKNYFLEKNPPNIIFVQLESMGRHFLLYDKEGYNDLWGNLRPYLKKDLIFTSFLSSHNDTPGSLTELLISSPLRFTFESQLNQIQYPTSVAKIFKQSGYKTVFISSTPLGWFNLAEALKKQGFDQVIGEHQIIKKIPNATVEWWGVYDEYTFEYALSLLKKAERHHQPIFIYINTATNHAYYLPPFDYQAKPVHFVASLAKHMNVSHAKLMNMLKTYQYTNNELGNFIHAIENTAFANKTIIAAAGDHNQHEIKNTYNKYPEELALKNSVYFFLHIPEIYKNSRSFNTQRVASHKDIFPTLYNLALSHANYPNFGNNLASSESNTSFDFGLNENTVLLNAGIIPLDRSETFFYPWKDKTHTLVGQAQPLNEEQIMMLKKIKAYNALRLWLQGWEYKRKVLEPRMQTE